MTTCGIYNHEQDDEVQKLVEQLVHPHTKKRLKAVECLAQKGPEAKPALSALVLRLVDFDPRVRLAANQALLSIDKDWTTNSIIKPILPQLVKALGKSSTREPRWALSVIARIGRSAVPELVKALSDETDDVKQVWAARTLGRIGVDAQEAAVDLGKAIHNTKIQVREAAARALVELNAAAVPALSDLVEALSDKQSNVRADAARSLKRLGPLASTAIPRLLTLLGDHVDDVRESAIDALAAIGSKAVPSLIGIIENRTRRRSKAFTELLVDMLKVLENADPSALGHYRAESCRNLQWHLQYAFERSPEKIHKAVIIILGMIGLEANEALPVLRDMLKTENLLLRKEAARAIKRIAPTIDADLEALVEATIHENPIGGSYALEAIPEIDPELLNRLQIEEFLTSLPQKCINTNDRETATKLLKLIIKVETHVEEDVRVRKAAEKALKKMSPSRPRTRTNRTPRRRRGFGFGAYR